MNTEPRLSLKRYLSFFLTGFILFSSACKKKDDPTPEEQTDNSTINEWVTENMRTVYYWNERIPADRNLNFQLDPVDFFETILNRPTDRFSWIAKADELKEQLGGISTTTGMNVSLIGYDCDQNGGNCQNVLGTVRYVIPGSPADLSGVERGALFTSVNGTKMTMGNYRSVFAEPYDSGKGFTITLATLSDDNRLTETNRVIDLSSTRVEEPSVYLSKVLITASGKKVGYIFYNTFLNNKIEEVFTAFNELKSAGVSDLILDLRYNLGGGISAAGVIAALIKQDYDKDQIFVNYNYNDLLNNEFDREGESRDQSFYGLFPGTVPLPERATDAQHEAAAKLIDGQVKTANLNLSKVYILGTGNSASASELVIHNLAPYMNVTHIGEATIGKNEGSFTIEDERTPRVIEWAIQPIVVKLADKNGEGDYDSGLIPDYEVDEFERLPFLPLGDKADPLIAKALTLIDPAEARSVLSRSRMASERSIQKATLSPLNDFNKKNIEPLPVQMDGAIEKDILKRLGR